MEYRGSKWKLVGHPIGRREIIVITAVIILIKIVSKNVIVLVQGQTTLVMKRNSNSLCWYNAEKNLYFSGSVDVCGKILLRY